MVHECAFKEVAWDCATGNGQAAVSLSPHFKKIIATDLSSDQIKNAITKPNIEYQVLKAEEHLNIPDQSVDLITIAQALHWFDFKIFYPEAKCVLKPNGIIAAWAYGFHESLSPEIDAIFKTFNQEKIGPFWKIQNQWISESYKDVPFPFQEIPAPDFYLTVNWTLEEFTGYCRSWSATQLYIEKHGVDPIPQLQKDLLPHWPPNLQKEVKWKLVLKIGKKFL
jgi:SAM-dependent methyltransferase